MFSVYRDIIPFFVHTQVYGLGKNASSSNLGMAEIFLFRLVCVTTIGVCVFRCVASVAHLFYMLIGGYMNKDISRKVIDVTVTELTSGEPTVCLGNGEQGFECCCDECDYFLLCFPEYNIRNGEEDMDLEKIICECCAKRLQASRKQPM